MKLRKYQLEAADSVDYSLAVSENPLVVIPTGGGKSLIIAETIKRLVARPSRPSILVLSHVKELIEQNSTTLRRYAPEVSQGLYSAGLKEKRSSAQVVLGTVQTAARSLNALGKRAFILIDEAHLCPRKQASQYGSVFEHYRLSQRIGFTATNMRLDSGTLTSGDDAWFDSVSYEVPVGDLIRDGYLLPLSGVLTEQQAIMDGVRSRAGDFIAERAEEEVMKLSLDEVIDEMLVLSQLRKHLLIFAAGVAHAKAVSEALEKVGIKAGLVLGDTSDGERDEVIAKFKAGKLRALISVGVLTTGFDAPLVDCIACLRPTRSAVLWAQMLGRGMRLSPKTQKKNCLLLDFVGNLDRLGGAGCVEEIEDHRDRNPARAEARRRAAEEVKRKEIELLAASHADPMGLSSTGPFEAEVTRMRYFLVPSRTQPGRKILCADYGLEVDGRPFAARTFLCVEYREHFPRQQVERWFRRRGVPPAEVPRDAKTALALAKVLPEPERVRAYWDPGMKSYLVVNEGFAAAVSP